MGVGPVARPACEASEMFETARWCEIVWPPPALALRSGSFTRGQRHTLVGKGGAGMNRSTRRAFLKTSGAGLGLAAASVAGLGGCATSTKGDFMPKSSRRVVVVGGGWGGATAAKYVRVEDPAIEVVMLEPNRQFISCPFSNLVLSGLRTIDTLTFSYDNLKKRGVKV